MKWMTLVVGIVFLLAGSRAIAQSPQGQEEEIRRLRAQIQQAESELETLTGRVRKLKESLAKLEGKQTPTSGSKLRFRAEVARAMLLEGTRHVPLPKSEYENIAPRNKEAAPRPPRR